MNCLLIDFRLSSQNNGICPSLTFGIYSKVNTDNFKLICHDIKLMCVDNPSIELDLSIDKRITIEESDIALHHIEAHIYQVAISKSKISSCGEERLKGGKSSKCMRGEFEFCFFAESDSGCSRTNFQIVKNSGVKRTLSHDETTPPDSPCDDQEMSDSGHSNSNSQVGGNVDVNRTQNNDEQTQYDSSSDIQDSNSMCSGYRQLKRPRLEIGDYHLGDEFWNSDSDISRDIFDLLDQNQQSDEESECNTRPSDYSFLSLFN